MGYAVWAVDPVADASAFPGADAVATEPRGLPASKTSAPVFAVVATQGQWDEDALVAALAHEPAYLGVVASPKRFGEMKAFLTGKVPEAALARVKNPAGLDLGARRPEEIALSILAEIVKEQRAAAAHTAPAPAAEAPASTEAVDPVCGMTVEVASARHKARHAGRDFYFCASGCRERFLAMPERYFTTAGAP
jgi:xanthine dehydrogenase accessory factor